MKGWDIIGYHYKADIYCPAHAYEEVCKDVGAEPANGSTYEEDLDVIAENLGIDRQDEHSYDSDNFPKVVFASSYEGENCASCHEPLLEAL